MAQPGGRGATAQGPFCQQPTHSLCPCPSPLTPTNSPAPDRRPAASPASITPGDSRLSPTHGLGGSPGEQPLSSRPGPAPALRPWPQSASLRLAVAVQPSWSWPCSWPLPTTQAGPRKVPPGPSTSGLSVTPMETPAHGLLWALTLRLLRPPGVLPAPRSRGGRPPPPWPGAQRDRDHYVCRALGASWGGG